MNDFIVRKRRGKGFSYFRDGASVSQETLQRIAALAIPPAWKDVRIAVGKRAKVQATGIDASGRKQYIYSPAHTARRDRQKFDRINQFAAQLPKLRRQVEKDLRRRRFDKRKVLACAVSLMDQEYFRVGNPTYAKENGTFGLTTLRSKHVTVKGDRVIFDFVGKSGQVHHKEIDDATIARLIRKLDDMPGYELFRYYDQRNELCNLSSVDVNTYIKEIMGDDYSAKDFRTWGGTLLAAVELATVARPTVKAKRKKTVSLCVERVAKKLGNTPAIARSSYIDPRIFDAYERADGLAKLYKTVSAMRPKKYISNEERMVMRLLGN